MIRARPRARILRYVPVLLAFAMAVTSCHAHQRIWVHTNGIIADQAAFQRDGIDCEAMTRAGTLSFGGGFIGEANAQDFLLRCMQSRGYMLIDAQNVTSGPGPSAARDAAQRCRRDCERAQRDAQCFENCKNFE